MKLNQIFFTLFTFLSTTTLSAYEMDFHLPMSHWSSHLEQKNWLSDAPPLKHEPRPDQKEESGTRSFFAQWFIGPLLMPSPTTADPKHPCIEPGVTVFDYYGNYDNDWRINATTPKQWTVNYLAYWQMGFTKRLGAELIASYNMNYQGKLSAYGFLDTILRLGYQITWDKHQKGSWTPDFRVILQETFPTGRYHKLSPEKNGLDSLGAGTFVSGLFLVGQKGFAWPSDHAFNLSLAAGYFLQSSAKVKGLNTYGGNRSTDGRVYPGNIISVFFSGEFEVAQHLAFAFDSNYQQTLSGFFRGKQGFGDPVTVPQNVFFQLAIPEVEIIISEQAGFIFGPWFTFSGQNTPAFVSFFVDFLYIF